MWRRGGKKLKRDWSQKRYGNPLFKERVSARHTTRLHVWIRRFVSLLVFACAGGVLWLIFLSPVLAINNVEINGNERVAKESVEKIVRDIMQTKRWLVVPETNLLALDAAALSAKLNDNFVLNELVIKKRPLHRLIVDIKEKPYNLIWHEGGQYYWVSVDGTIITEAFGLASTSERTDLPFIENQGDWVATAKKLEGQTAKLEFINDLAEKLKTSQLQLKPEKFVISSGEDPSVKIQATGTPLIIFSVKNDLEKQLNSLLAFIRGIPKEDFKKKIKIDLRFGEKIFFE